MMLIVDEACQGEMPISTKSFCRIREFVSGGHDLVIVKSDKELFRLF